MEARRVTGVLSVLLSLALTAPATAQTVVNGSFEADVVPAGLTSIAGLTGWTVGADGGYPVLAHEAYPIDVPDGSQAIMLGEYNGYTLTRSSYIEQTISGFIVGHAYELSFSIASANSGCGGGCGQAAVTVSFPSGSSTGAATFVAPVSGGVYGLKDWVAYTYTFVPADSSITLRFAIAPPVGFMYEGVGIDAVAVNAVGTANEPPTASAGPSQTVRPGSTVHLDGSGSFDDNTPSSLLQYAWSFSLVPAGSQAALVGANTISPSFVPDVPGTYAIQLVVTDQEGLSSTPSIVTVGENVAPSADAGLDQLVIVGAVVDLNGSGSDPDGDTLSYAWALTGMPAGSTAQPHNPTSAQTTFIPDLPGVYTASLTVSDFLGAGEPDTVQMTATTLSGYVETQLQGIGAYLAGLEPTAVTNRGNQTALTQFLSNAIVALQGGDLAAAAHQIEQAISRLDGCALRGIPDGNGAGRDWITSCDAQSEMYPVLVDALTAIQP
jgi:hypothetical protein